MFLVGTVIICQWHEATDSNLLREMILGKVERLESKFRLTYNMILNLLRVEDFKVEEMLKRSFSESMLQRETPKRKKMLQFVQKELDSMPPMECIYGEPDMENYYPSAQRVRELDVKLQKQIVKTACKKFPLSMTIKILIN